MNGTYAYGISGSSIVGFYYDMDYGQHAFLYDGTSYTTLTPPGSSSATAYGVSGNMVVGTYADANDNYAQKGFIFDGITYTTLDIPGSTHSACLGVSGGDIVGYYNTADGNQHGFLMTPSGGGDVSPVPEVTSSFTLLGLITGGLMMRRRRDNQASVAVAS